MEYMILQHLVFVFPQVIFEGIRGQGIEGDIAIDDVTLEEGECPDPPSNRMYFIKRS